MTTLGYGAENAFDHDGDDRDEGFGGPRFGYGAGGCPPGLAKKTPAFIPKGLARRQSIIGQNAYSYANPYGVAQAPYGYNPYAVGQAPYGDSPYGYENQYAARYGAYCAPVYGNGYQHT